MEIEANREKNSIEIDIKGEDHTFCNLLTEKLQHDPNVEYAAYDISHPYVAHPKLLVRVKGKKKPQNIIAKAAEDIKNDNKEISTIFKKVISK